MRRSSLAVLLAVVMAVPAAVVYADVTPSVHSGDLHNCSDFASQADAQAHLRLNPTDPDKLDSNRDGVACESLGGAQDRVPVSVPQATVSPLPTATTTTIAPTATSTPDPAAGTGEIIGGAVPRASGGFSLFVFGGGSTGQLVTAACANSSGAAYWVTDAMGAFITYVPGTTIGVVNTAWLARFSAGIPSGTPIIGRCPASVVPSMMSGTARQQLSLLVVADHAQGIPPYSRDDWQAWIDADHDCQDTRAEVLISESTVPVAFTDSSGCRVAAGAWLDPYTGATFMDASALDIDHLVPLENAYASGAWQWDNTKKRDYANDLTHPEQLLAVSASANRSKGSQGPEDWKPVRNAFWCEYATDWIGIKLRWGLTATSGERAALDSMLNTCAP